MPALRPPFAARRAGALLSAAALAAGALVAVAGPARADAAASVTSTSTYVDSLGIRHLVGEVANTGTVDLLAPRVDMQVTDPSGAVVDTPFADAALAVLAPGEKAPFETQTSATSYGGFRVVAVSAQPSGRAPNHNLAVTVTQRFVDAQGNRQLSGTVRNDNRTSADAPQVVVTYYDAAGTAVASDTTSTDNGAALAPGATAGFTTIAGPDVPAFSSFALVGESPTPADRNPDAPPPSSGPPPPETALNCDPTMTLSTHQVVTGQSVTVAVTGTPGSYVTLEGYSRPSTDYAPIRRDVQLDGAGAAAPFAVRPSTAARIRLQVRGCATPGTGQVIAVTPVLTVTATRLAPFRYRFAGKISPAVANTGRAISLYYQASSGAPVRKGIARSAADGTYAATLSFLPGRTQRLAFFWGTGADQTNSAARSATRTLLVY